MVEETLQANYLQSRSVEDRNRLVEFYLGRIRAVAKLEARRLWNRGRLCHLLEEFVSHAALGAIKAVEKWDPNRGPLPAAICYKARMEIREVVRTRLGRIGSTRAQTRVCLEFWALVSKIQPEDDGEEWLSYDGKTIIANLPDRDREAFEHWLADLPRHEIAARMGIPEKEVDACVNRSLDRLQRGVKRKRGGK